MPIYSACDAKCMNTALNDFKISPNNQSTFPPLFSSCPSTIGKCAMIMCGIYHFHYQHHFQQTKKQLSRRILHKCVIILFKSCSCMMSYRVACIYSLCGIRCCHRSITFSIVQTPHRRVENYTVEWV